MRLGILRGRRMAMFGLLLAGGIAGASLAASAPARAATYPEAVVLVSGFNTISPFTTPDPACDSQTGEVWNVPTGPAPALKAAGFSVFTAPVRHLDDAPAPPCPASGEPLPPQSAYVNSGGDIDSNGAALASFLAFLRDNYGVTKVHLVGHSDGGNWSRSAIGQGGIYPGVQVASLTTLGTPYNGSFLADVALELQGAGCDFSKATEQRICKLLLDLVDLVIADQGTTATRQLTHSFLIEWNGTQRMAACPVTTIAGTFFDLPLLRLPYYDPADGYVGRASALAQASRSFTSQPIPAPDIPDLRQGGTFPVVHAASLRVFSPNNLLNQTAISSQVAAIVSGLPAGLPACNALTASSAASAAAAPDAAASVKRKLSLRLPLRLVSATSQRNRLGPPGPDDVVVAGEGAKLRCGKRRPTATPLLGDGRLRLALAAQCRKPVSVTGGRALMLRSHPVAEAIVTVRGRKLRVRVTGTTTKEMRAAVTVGGRKRALRLDAKGRGKLPAKDAVLRLVVDTSPGPSTASAVIAAG